MSRLIKLVEIQHLSLVIPLLLTSWPLWCSWLHIFWSVNFVESFGTTTSSVLVKRELPSKKNTGTSSLTTFGIDNHHSFYYCSNNNNKNNNNIICLSAVVSSSSSSSDDTNYNHTNKKRTSKKQSPQTTRTILSSSSLPPPSSSTASKKKQRKLTTSATSNPTKTKSEQIKQKSLLHGTNPLLSLNLNLDSLAKSNQPNSAKRAEELLLRIEHLYDEGYYETSPDCVSYNSVMNGYARLLGSDSNTNGGDGPTAGNEGEAGTNVNNNYDALEDVMRIWKRMQDYETNSNSNSSIKPTIVTYNTVIRSLAKNGYGTKAEELLNHMENEFYRKGQNVPLGPNNITFNSVIDAYAKCRRPLDAERILRQMMVLSRQNEINKYMRLEEIKADTVSFNTVLHAWATSKQRGAGYRSSQLLKHMEKLYNAGNLDVRPDVFSYTAVMSAWVFEQQQLSLQKKNHVHHHSSKHPQRKLNEKGTTTISAADEAIALLHKMEEACALGQEHMCPNIISYTAAINAVARSGNKNSAKKAHEILKQLEYQYYKSGNDEEGEGGNSGCNVKPDLICYSSVIDAYARCDNGGDHRNRIPVGKEEDDDAGEKALQILNHMIDLSEEEGDVTIQPNTQVYCSVIVALGKSCKKGSADIAQKILNDMEKIYINSEGKNDHVKPNTIVCNAVINAWSRSSFIFKADRAYQLLCRMENSYQTYKQQLNVNDSGAKKGGSSSSGNKNKVVLYYRPDIITYNSVINTAANSFGDFKIKSRALSIATDTFKKVRKLQQQNVLTSSKDVDAPTTTTPMMASIVRPTSRTYSHFIKAIRKLLTDGKKKDLLIGKVLHLCCNDGLMNHHVLSQLQITCSCKEEFEKLLKNHIIDYYTKVGKEGLVKNGSDIITMKDVPEDWQRNSHRKR